MHTITWHSKASRPPCSHIQSYRDGICHATPCPRMSFGRVWDLRSLQRCSGVATTGDARPPSQSRTSCFRSSFAACGTRNHARTRTPCAFDFFKSLSLEGQNSCYGLGFAKDRPKARLLSVFLHADRDVPCMSDELWQMGCSHYPSLVLTGSHKGRHF